MSKTMTEDEQELTAWQVWLHPKRTSAMVQQLHCDLQQARQEAADTLNSLESQIAELKKTRSALQAENTELSLKYIRLEEEYSAQDAQIDEIQAMFEQVESMKARYEKRIAKYKGRMADLERALRRAENAANNDIEPLPPLPGVKPSPGHTEPSPPPDEIDPSADWYHPLDL